MLTMPRIVRRQYAVGDLIAMRSVIRPLEVDGPPEDLGNVRVIAMFHSDGSMVGEPILDLEDQQRGRDAVLELGLDVQLAITEIDLMRTGQWAAGIGTLYLDDKPQLLQCEQCKRWLPRIEMAVGADSEGDIPITYRKCGECDPRPGATLPPRPSRPRGPSPSSPG